MYLHIFILERPKLNCMEICEECGNECDAKIVNWKLLCETCSDGFEVEELIIPVETY